MDALRRIYAKIAQQLGALGTTHKLLIGSLAVIAVMTLFLVSRYASRGTLVEFMPAATAAASDGLDVSADRRHQHC